MQSHNEHASKILNHGDKDAVLMQVEFDIQERSLEFRVRCSCTEFVVTVYEYCQLIHIGYETERRY